VQRSPRLRLAWVNPGPQSVPGDSPPRAPLSLVAAPPPVPGRRVKLDLAIERHLEGHDGLSEQEFLLVFSGRQVHSSG
jgi:hypothetical protein